MLGYIFMDKVGQDGGHIFAIGGGGGFELIVQVAFYVQIHAFQLRYDWLSFRFQWAHLADGRYVQQVSI